MPKRLPTPKGYRRLKSGERIQAADIYWMHGDPEIGLSTGACRPSIGQKFDPPMQTQYY